MEVHPILECGDNPSKGLWYVISSDKPPDARVGQACVSRSNDASGTDEILAIGGANPSATFSDVYRLDLTTFQWNQLESKGLRSRYEHAAFVPTASPNSVYIFGGANKSGNLDCLQAYDTESSTWNLVSFNGHSPGPRTLHSGASSGNKLFVWGGGHLGADPVPDLQLHVFDAVTKTWTQHQLQGEVPTARHGHVMIVVGSTLYIHGGMAGTNFYGDLYAVDLSDYSCRKVADNGEFPCERAAHSACTYQSQIYIFGGMCPEGAMNDMYCFDTISQTWRSMKFDCPPPAPRLDHSFLFTLLPVRKESLVPSEIGSNETKNESNANVGANGDSAPRIVPVDIWQGTVTGNSNGMQNLSLRDAGDMVPDVAEQGGDPVANVPNGNGASPKDYTYVPVCVVIGGMDTSGNLFNDVLITTVGENA